MARILVTNNGTHSPEKWAMTTAEMIFDIGSAIAGDHLIQAQKLQLAIAEALVPHHDSVQTTEKSRLTDDVSHIHTPHSADEYLDDTIASILAAAKGTPWEAHFKRSEVQDAAREVIANHFMTAQHIERLWHADRNPDCAVSQAYKARFHG